MQASRVLIVGAGPVGLVAGMYLASQGVPVTIVEASADVQHDLRASTFHPPTLDMLDTFGVTETLIAQGIVCPTWQFRDRRDGVVATFDLGLLSGETAHPYRLQCEQWKLARLLRARLAEMSGVEFQFGYNAVDVRQDADGVVVTLTDAGGASSECRGDYLIAADGARSAIRKSLGVPFEGMTIPELYLTLSTSHPFEGDMPDLANIAYISDPEEWLVLLRTPTLWRVLLPTAADLTDADLKDPAYIEARLQQVQPSAKPYEVIHKTAYRVHERVADRYVVGRVFLAGDAAHVNNPLGGMGMNGGIHDAMNLAEKLVRVCDGAPLETMGRYERQRRKVAIETVQAQTIRNRQMLNERDAAARGAYQDEMRRMVADRDAHRTYVRRSSMLQSLHDLEEVA